LVEVLLQGPDFQLLVLQCGLCIFEDALLSLLGLLLPLLFLKQLVVLPLEVLKFCLIRSLLVSNPVFGGCYLFFNLLDIGHVPIPPAFVVLDLLVTRMQEPLVKINDWLVLHLGITLVADSVLLGIRLAELDLLLRALGADRSPALAAIMVEPFQDIELLAAMFACILFLFLNLRMVEMFWQIRQICQKFNNLLTLLLTLVLFGCVLLAEES